MPEPEDDVERVIVACIERRVKANPPSLTRAILETLWNAGYGVTRRPDMIPIRRNPGEDCANG